MYLMRSIIVGVLCLAIWLSPSALAKDVEPSSSFADIEQKIKNAMSDRLIGKAYELMLDAKYSEAVTAFDEARESLGDTPSAIVVFSGRGTIYFVQKQYFKALDDCDKALELTHVTDSDFAQAKQFPNLSAILNTCLNLRFACHLKSEKYEEALSDDDRLALWKPENVDESRHMFRGGLLALLGKVKEANKEFDFVAKSGDEQLVRAGASGKELCAQIEAADETQKKIICDQFKSMVMAQLGEIDPAKTMRSVGDKARDASCKANMRSLQIAVEMYATDHEGIYPTKIAEIDKYARANSPGVWPIKDPFTGRAISPILGAIKQIQKARDAEPNQMVPGSIEYSVLDGGVAYAIRGGGHDGKAIPATVRGKTLVLSNQ